MANVSRSDSAHALVAPKWGVFSRQQCATLGYNLHGGEWVLTAGFALHLLPNGYPFARPDPNGGIVTHTTVDAQAAQ